MNEKENSRPPTANEKELIAYLLEKAVLPLEYLESMTVTSMNDGGWGFNDLSPLLDLSTWKKFK